MVYDLEERTLKFSENIIKIIKTIDNNYLTQPIVNQLIRSATSIGANYCEANNASSKKDFRNKIFICKKEANETKYWLQLLSNLSTNNITKIRLLWKEAQELNLIFQKIINSLNQSNKN